MRNTGRLSSLLATLTMMALLANLIPSPALAVSANTVSAVPKVACNYSFLEASTSPILRIEESPTEGFSTNKQTITLTLSNAEWTNDSKSVIESQVQTGDASSLTFTKVSASVAQIELVPKDPRTADTVACFQIPMICRVLNAGEARVSMEGGGSSASGADLVFATVAEPGTTLTVASERTVAESITLDTLRLEENTIDSIHGSFQFQLVLSGSSVWAQVPSASDVSFEGGFSGDASSIHIQELDPNNPQVLVAWFTPSRNLQEKGALLLKNLQVRTPSSAIGNDVKVQIVPFISDDFKGQVTAQELLVARPATVPSHDHDHTSDVNVLPCVEVVAGGDARSLLSGRYGVGDAPECNRVQDVIIREKTAGSWVSGRTTSIQLPNDVKIMGYTVVQADNMDLDTTRIGGDAAALNVYRNYLTQNSSVLTMTHSKKGSSSDCMTLRLRLYLSVKADFTGDISANVSGPSMSNTGTALLAHVVPAGTIAIEKTETVTSGFQRSLPRITITEPKKGAWLSGKDLVLTLPDGVSFCNIPTVQVEKGDVTITNIRAEGQKLLIRIKFDSTVASALSIRGCMIKAGSTCSEGSYSIQLGGDALVENWARDELAGKYNRDYVSSMKAITVVAPSTNPAEKKANVLFKLGSKNSKVGDKDKAVDVSPYLNEKGQKMLSLRALANALGIKDENIMWNNRDRSVVILKGNTTIQVRIGENKINTNSMEIPMDTPAVIKDGRTMLDLTALTKAFNCEFSCDEQQQTMLIQECTSIR